MKRALLGLVGVALVAGLTACGAGGGDPGVSPFGSNSSSTGSGTTTNPDGTTVVVASDVFVVLSKASVVNSGSDTVTVTATAVDASRNAVPNIPIRFSANSGGVVVPAGTATDDSGQLTATVGIGADKTNRAVTVTVSSGSLVRTVSFLVTGGKLTGTAIPVTPNVSTTGNKVVFILTDANSIPVPGQVVTVNGPGTATGTGTTGADGSYEYVYTAPTVAGVSTITARAGGLDPIRVDVNVLDPGGSVVVPDAVGPVQSASIAADPSVVSTNSGASNNFAQIRAQFLGPNNTPVENVRVRFDLGGDPNSIGGTFPSGSSSINSLSDGNGIATTRYTPGSRSSPTNGVIVRACYGNTDADLANGACPNSASTTLTVASDPVSVTIGTDNTISNGADGLTYVKRFAVMVVNASGQAMRDVQITPSVDLVRYYKGAWGAATGVTCPNGAAPTNSLCQGLSGATQSPADLDDGSIQGCLNEDLNRNGSLETSGVVGALGGTEDFNGNGILEPRKADVSIRAVGSSVTDESGIVILQLEYPENIATWVKYKILVSASGVSGSEGRDEFTGILPALNSDFQNPAFLVSPYGFAATCSDPT